MKKLRKIYEAFETDAETLLAEEIMNEDKEMADKHFSKCNAVIELQKFKTTYINLEKKIFPKMFTSAIKALGSNGNILSEIDIVKLKASRNHIHLNACKIYINKKELLLIVTGNIYTLKLEVEINSKGLLQSLKEYDLNDFSEEKLEDQLLDFFKNESKPSFKIS